jgi:anti-sigma regulatory factor (Ser/Thr protein kinase)
MLGTLCVFALAYRYYSAFLAAKVAVLNDARITPAHEYEDGHNYVPSPKWVLFGHHFAAIAGAGPLVGPTLAAQFGFAPGFLWLLIGAVLAGCVQDFMVLVASVRHKGRSLAQIARTLTYDSADPRFGQPLTIRTQGQNDVVNLRYDEFGRVRRVWDALGSEATYNHQFLYNLADQILSVTYPPIGQATAAIRPQAEEKQVAVEVSLPPDLPLPLADGGRIQQVVFNLLDNGLRHTPAGGRLSVLARREDGHVVVSVADTGEGIPPEELPLVFERFRKRHSQGRGLGLAIVRSIVRGHGGEVSVTSTPGRGSTFSFTLPL